jgi:hypothetical protein
LERARCGSSSLRLIRRRVLGVGTLRARGHVHVRVARAGHARNGHGKPSGDQGAARFPTKRNGSVDKTHTLLRDSRIVTASQQRRLSGRDEGVLY